MGVMARVRQWFTAGAGEAPVVPSAISVGSVGQLSLRHEMRVGAVVLRKGTYALSHTFAADVDVLVLTLVDARTSDGPAGARRQRIGAHQFVMRSTVFAEEYDDQSVRVKLVQFTGDAPADGPAA